MPCPGLEGCSESLRLEVNALEIKVVLVEPGAFQDSFVAGTEATASFSVHASISGGSVHGLMEEHLHSVQRKRTDPAIHTSTGDPSDC